LSEPRQLAEHFFRHEYGRLVAMLTRRTGAQHIEAVEDAVQAALMSALESWTVAGVPDNPSAWLYRVARNGLWDDLRQRTRHRRLMEENATEVVAALEQGPEPSLADEMQRMRPAQLALAAGDPTRALALLATYLETFPDGRLHEEYLALRAIALCSAGPAPAGRTEADAFLAAHPRSIFAERVRGACDPR